MKVGIVGITENDFIRGVERYTLELVRHMAILYPDTKFFLLKGRWQTYYDELEKFKNIQLITINNLRNSKINRHFFIAFRLFDFLKQKNINLDVIHYNNTLPIIRKTPIPSVITIHDIAEFFVPEKYSLIQRIYRRLMVKISAKNADFIITVSKFSKKNIIEKLSIPKERIKEIYLGVEHFLLEGKAQIFSNSKINLRSIINSSYILYWSVIEHSKGIIETVKAFNLLNKKYPDLKLLVIGKKGNAYKEFLKFLNKNENIIYLGFVSDEELRFYIKRAKVILFPSKYEGFGFPPLEAFVLNNNVVVSNTTSLGEITKDFAEQVNPNDIYDIMKKVEKLLLNPKKMSYQEKLNIIQKFSWNNTAKETYSIYKKLIKEV